MDIDKGRLFELVEKYTKRSASGCLEWTRCTTEGGYGLITMNRKNLYMHRAVWAAHNGDIGKKDVVCHKCDNRRCVNIEHLFLGDHKTNWTDAFVKGRMSKNAPRGSSQHRSSATEELAVLVARPSKEGCSVLEISERTGLSRGCVGPILRGWTWSHVTGIPKSDPPSTIRRREMAIVRAKKYMEEFSNDTLK